MELDSMQMGLVMTLDDILRLLVHRLNFYSFLLFFIHFRSFSFTDMFCRYLLTYWVRILFNCILLFLQVHIVLLL
jgi:hypothetical protein